MRKGDVGRAALRARVLGIDAAPLLRGGALDAKLGGGLQRVGEALVRHVLPPRRDARAQLLGRVGILEAAQAELDARVHRVRVALRARRVGAGAVKVRPLLLRGDAVGMDAGALSNVPLVDHRVDALLLLGQVAQHLLRLEHEPIALLGRHRAPVATHAVDALLLGRRLVNRVGAQHLGVEHALADLARHLVSLLAHVVEQRADEVLVVAKLDARRVLVLTLGNGGDEARVRLLVEVPEELEQAVVGHDVAVHRARKGQVEDVAHVDVVAHEEATLLPHPLRRAEAALGIVVVVGVGLLGVDVERVAIVVDAASNRDVDARVPWRDDVGRDVPLEVERDARAERVLAAAFLLLHKRPRLASDGRVGTNVRVQGTAAAPVALARVRLVHLDQIGHVRDALVLRRRRALHVLVVDLRALQLVLLHHLGRAERLGNAVDGAGARDLGILVHELAPELVVRVAVVVDLLEDAVRQDLVARAVVELLKAPAKLHRRVVAQRDVRALGIRLVGVRFDVALQLLLVLVELLALHVLDLGRVELGVVGAADPTLGRARREHAPQGRKGHAPRPLDRIGVRRDVAQALRVVLKVVLVGAH